MNVLIVGANGFLAQALAKIISDQGDHSLTGIYHQNRDKIQEHLFQDIFPSSQITTLPDHFDWIFLLAAHIPKKNEKETDKQLQESNCDLVKTVCDKFHAGRIVFSSSVSVYPPMGDVIDEKTQVQPSSAYGKSKQDGERLVMQKKDYGIIRFSSLYGVGMRATTFLPRLIQQAKKEKKITLWGKGERLQDYLHVADAAQMLIQTAQNDLRGAFLGVYGRSYSNLELAQKVAHWARGVSVERLNEDKSPSFVYDARWSHAQLNYQPQISIEEGLKELFNHE